MVDGMRQSEEAAGRTVLPWTGANSCYGAAPAFAAKPDLITFGGHDVAVINVVPDGSKLADAALVKLCQFAAARTRFRHRHRYDRVSGHIRYFSGSNGLVPHPVVSREFMERLGAMVTSLAAEEPANRTPRSAECQRCDIAGCTERAAG